MWDETKFWHIDYGGGLELLRARYTTHVYPRHMHETYVIEVVEEGADQFECKGQTCMAGAGSIVLINPLEVHTGRPVSRRPLKYRSLYPRSEFMARIAAQFDLNDAPFFPSHVVDDPVLSQKLLEAHCSLEENRDDLESQSLLVLALSRLIRHHGEKPVPDFPLGKHSLSIRRASEYIEEHHHGKISLNELAVTCGMSPFHFLRLFRTEMNLPPHEYLTNIRVRHAKSLLKKGISIVQVAHETGFYDQSHLTRCFKSLVGVTPGQYITRPIQ